MGGEASLLTAGAGGRNCPEHQSRTRKDIRLRSGRATCEWPGRVQHPVRVIQVEGSSFRAFHFDLEDEADSLLCLTGGKKLWLFAPPGNIAGVLERQCGGNDSQSGFTSAVGSLRALSKREKKTLRFAVLDNSKTLYLPYGWAHAVVTLCEPTLVCSMWYLELVTPAQRIEETRKKARQHCRSGVRREEALSS